MAIISVNNPTTRAYFVFLIETLEKYKANMYIVVSVLPCITDAILPVNVSGPILLSILSKIKKDEDPLIGLIIASGNNSFGISGIFIYVII